MLPAISIEACLSADLGIDPGRAGIQSHTAANFLIFRRVFDTASYLLLHQINLIGSQNEPRSPCNRTGLELLADYLASFYGGDHQVIVYRLNDDALDIGEAEVRTALNALAQCVESGKWPGYAPALHDLNLPDWRLRMAHSVDFLEVA